MNNTDEVKYEPFYSANFKKTYKKAKKQGLNIDALKWGIEQLAKDLPLPVSWYDHKLTNFKPKSGRKGNFRECHIDGSGNWLLVYEKQEGIMLLYLYGIGSHADLLNL